MRIDVRAALRLALLFAAIKLLLQFTLTLWTQHIGYSYFRDEFYYIACGRHLARAPSLTPPSSPCKHASASSSSATLYSPSAFSPHSPEPPPFSSPACSPG